MEEDQRGLAAFKECLMNPNVALTSVDLMYNRIGKSCPPSQMQSSPWQILSALRRAAMF
jgi:hypothetical protein